MKSPAGFILVSLFFAGLCGPLIFSNRDGGYASDERDFYLPAIRQIAAKWPRLDLVADSRSATAPGYPYLLATATRLVGVNRLALRLVTWAISLAVLLVLWRSFPSGREPLATAAVLPLAASNFFVKSASWVVTDNAALLATSGCLLLLFLSRGAGLALLAGLFAGAAVFIRQLCCWLAGPCLLRVLRPLAGDPPMVRRAWAAAVLPATAVLALLVIAWGGVVPPAWQGVVGSTANAGATAAYALAVFALCGAVYLAALTRARPQGPLLDRLTIAGICVGLVAALAGPTDYNPAAGRWGGYLWAAADLLPAIGDRSVFFLLAAPLGGGLLARMAGRLAETAGRDLALLWLLSYLCWAASLMTANLVFQRYFEPMTLVFLVIWSALLARSGDRTAPRLGFIYTFTAGQTAVTLLTAHYRTFS